MTGKFHHETLYRGPELVAKLSRIRHTICGAGALGSNLADNLVRQGVAHLRIIDHDRVEEHNISTQLYGESDVGVWKVEALRNRLFRTTGVEIDTVSKELRPGNARQLLKESDLIADAFDNAVARSSVQDYARNSGTACLHLGLLVDYCEVIWDEHYRVPQDVSGNVCDYPLARNVALLAVVIASEAIMRSLECGDRVSWSGTLRDFAVHLMLGT